MAKAYDIFISYRRLDAGDKAEHLKDLLEQDYKGRISFDRENLSGLFDINIISRIDACTDFLLILGKESLNFNEADFAPDAVALYEYLGTCSQSEFAAKIQTLGPNAQLDFVRIEICRALHRPHLNIIPIAPEGQPSYNFGKLQLPPDIARILRYEAQFYSESPNALFKDVVPKIKKHLMSRPKSAAGRWLPLVGTAGILLLLAASFLFYRAKQENEAMQQFMTKEALGGMPLNWAPQLSFEKVKIIREILDKMVPVEGGSFLMGADKNPSGTYDADVCTELETPQIQQKVASFWMSQSEVSEEEWGIIMDTPYDVENPSLPARNVSFDDCKRFTEQLLQYTGIAFTLPTEAEWEYAARGGIHHDSTKYSGSNNPAEVAVYASNSQGRPATGNPRNSSVKWNSLNLFHLSGNMSEWCDTDFRLLSDLASGNPHPEVIDPESKVIRGGNYLSEPMEITVFHREPMNRHQQSDNVGFRIIVK